MRKKLTIKDRVNGYPVAYLTPDPDGIENTYIETTLNGQITLKFILPPNSTKWKYIKKRYAIEADGYQFLLVGTEEERDDQGRLSSNVQYEGSYVELGEKFTNYVAVELLRSDANTVLTNLLAGTGWTVGTVELLDIHDLETEKMSCLANIWEVQNIWGGYLKFDTVNKRVHLYTNPGMKRPVHIRYGKNLKSIKRVTDTNTANRLIPYGKDGLDIRSVNGGTRYIEDFTLTRQELGLSSTDTVPTWAIREMVYERTDISEPNELKSEAEKELAKQVKEKVQYQAKMADLRELTGYEGEVFNVGDTVKIYDEELNIIDVEQMVIKNRYNYFEREECEVEIGDPLKDWADELAAISDASRFVKEQVTSSDGVKNLLKGMLAGTAQEIISGNGDLLWTNNGGFKMVEKDANGLATGREVIATSKGIMLRDTAGNQPDVAITPDGILASKIIVNALYALASEDGFTKMVADGIKVFDNAVTPNLRVHLGQYAAGKFGLLLKDAASNETILDESGILQTWQEGRTDNVASGKPITLYVYVPAETKAIKKALLRFRLLKFRAYETAASSGGGHTSGSSSLTTSNSANENITIDGYRYISGSSGDYTYSATAAADEHNHGIANGTALAKYGGGSVTFYHFSGAGHTHSLYNHGHYYTAGGHSHGMSHTHSVYDHTHGITFGIYEGTEALGVTVVINGTDRTSALGGGSGFNAHQDSLNIASYLTVGAWNTIQLSSTQLGRIDATVFIQALMGV